MSHRRRSKASKYVRESPNLHVETIELPGIVQDSTEQPLLEPIGSTGARRRSSFAQVIDEDAATMVKIARQGTLKRLDKIDGLLSQYEADSTFDLMGALIGVEEDEKGDDDAFIVGTGEHQGGTFAQEYVLDQEQRDKFKQREAMMRKKIDELRSQVVKLMESNAKLQKEKEDVDMEMELMETEKEKLELRSYLHTVSAINSNAATMADEREKQRKADEAAKRAKRDAAKKAAMESGVMMEDGDDDEYVGTTGSGDKYWRRRLKKAVQTFIRAVMPLEGDLRRVDAQFGSAITTYYRLFRWVFVQSAITCVTVILFTIWHVLDSIADLSTIIQYLPVPFLYSSYTQAESMLYASLLLVVFILLLSFTIQRIIWEDRKACTSEAEERVSENRFCKAALCCWDHGLVGDKRVNDYRVQVSEEFLVLLSETTMEGEIRERTSKEKALLWVRRLLGFIVVTALLAGAWAIILTLTIQEYAILTLARQDATLSGLAAFVVPAAVSIINLLMMPIIKLLTRFERWDSPGFALKFEVTRIFILKILNVGIVLFTYFQLLSGVTIIAGTEDTSVGTCVEDRVALGLFGLYLVDFVVKKVALIGTVLAKLIWCKLRHQPVTRSEFGLSGPVIDLIYSQVLLLMLFPYMPSCFVFGCIMYFLTFKWNIMTMRFYTRPKKPWRTRDTGSFFLVFYIIVFVLCVVGLWYFFVGVGHSCGPYNGTVVSLVSVLRADAVVNWIVWIITAPEVLWTIAVVLMVRFYLKRNVLIAFQSFYVKMFETHRREMEAVEKLVKKQARQITHFKQLREMDD